MDAIHPERLRDLVEDAITCHVDEAQLERLETVEAEERKLLAMLANTGIRNVVGAKSS
ncbi:hypothetical protein [Cupriavidus sp. AcVe19-6a]|uniref:hypothetical protein n=1 Tax=Cupriavidus sp. AcVe19-6a TaxID=2821358 RepID=UPI001AE5C36F|nr:hypothetical protein [Cupriavidus sp. AcVe19-6a]MBP0639575.1 hypothetical protein [Cupriavidus sp. AcVe19-6a]